MNLITTITELQHQQGRQQQEPPIRRRHPRQHRQFHQRHRR